MNRPSDAASKACGRCGTAFACKPHDISQCDCSAVSLSAEESRFISIQFNDCLCNSCLRELKQLYNSQEKTKAILCWSGGKDSAYALYHVLLENRYEVCYLLSTVNKTFRRVSMHGLREELLEVQARALGMALRKVEVEEDSNAEYERQMEAAFQQARSEGIGHVIFGDIFLEDLRAYREAHLARSGMQAVFPLWKEPTGELLRDFVARKFRTVLCCTNDAYLDESWAGREIGADFLHELPARVDACGEHGEYHSFCFDGPIFKYPVSFRHGEKIYKPLDLKFSEPSEKPVTKGFWFIDLLPC